MQHPSGFASSNPNHIYKLQKDIYGLKQAPHAWFQKLSNTVNQMVFNSTKSDPSLFT